MIFHVKLHYQLASFEQLTVLQGGEIVDSLIPLLDDIPGRHSVFVERDTGNVQFVMTVEADTVTDALTLALRQIDPTLPFTPEAVEVVGSREQWRRLGGGLAAEQVMSNLAGAARTQVTG